MAGTEQNQKRILDQWEPEYFRRVFSRKGSFKFQRQVEEEDASLLATTQAIEDKVTGTVALWATKPTPMELASMKVIALLVLEQRHWSKGNDLVSAMIFRLVVGPEIRGHSDGVVRYQQGAFQEIEEISSMDLMKVEKTLLLSAQMLRTLITGNVAFDVEQVFAALATYAQKTHNWKPVTSADFKHKKDDVYAAWAMDACQQTSAMISNFTRKETASSMVQLIGTWLQSHRPTPSPSIAFPDTFVVIDDSKVGDDRVTCKEKSPATNCYLYMDVELGLVVPDWAIDKLRGILASCWANNEDSWKIDTAQEALGWMCEIQPPVGCILSGDGGNSKSARTLLRSNVWGKHHKIVSSSCFQKEDELRIQ